ncbi:MAG: phenylalanine--tRNA ligase subunit beta [Patescibacteria group bacterium]|jgi:phenylalanyl-tRNA synthetase beta chain
MYLSLNWLKDYVEIPKNITPEELARLLTLHTVEIEGVLSQADKFKNVIAAKIIEVKKHPDADRLRLALVDTGKEKLEIVCGAPNIEAGQMVPLALIGAILPNGLEIKEVEVRGVKSNGMLCAPDELGLGDDHSGILILDKNAKTGKPLSEVLGLSDVLFEVDNKSITNRPDLWSHVGVAREIAAFLNARLTKKAEEINSALSGQKSGKLKIKTDDKLAVIKVAVEDKKLAPRYMALAMGGIKIGTSPDWLSQRLVAAGVRPINNIVDATNYVMLDIGQPMHAFDLAKLEPDLNKKEIFECYINVRKAKKGETITTLDGKERELNDETLVIADKEKPIAIAGVMGGAFSEISEETDSIVLESANFDFATIRKTSRFFGVRSESSMRFEKSLDPSLAAIALYRVVQLIKEICPSARVISEAVDERNFSQNTGPLEIKLSWIEERIGEAIPEAEVSRILKSLGFAVAKKSSGLIITIPTWRAGKDIAIREDIVEEVARIYGYNKITPAMPEISLNQAPREKARELKKKIRQILAFGARLTESYNYSFVSEEQLNKLQIDAGSAIRLLNPIAETMNLLAPTLVPNLVENIKKNQARRERISLFEIGTVYSNRPGELNKDASGKDKLLAQAERLAIAVAGGEADEVFLKLKSIIGFLLESLGLKAKFGLLDEKPGWMDGVRAAGIETNGVVIGTAGGFDSRIAKRAGVKKEAGLAEIDLSALAQFFPQPTGYSEFEKYPPVIRDLSFVLDAKILYNDMKEEIEKFSELVKSAEVFDVYEGKNLAAGKKSLAFHIIYQAGRTMKSEEVEEVQNALVKHLADKFGAKVRDF